MAPRLLENSLKAGARADAADINFVVLDAPDHVHVDHGHGFVERFGRILDPGGRSEQAEFLASKGREQDSAGKLAPKRRKDASELEHSGCSGSIVVGPWVDLGERLTSRFEPGIGNRVFHLGKEDANVFRAV